MATSSILSKNFIDGAKHDLRPCTVDGEKALFHTFYQESDVVGQSGLIGGHSAGQISTALALVELQDGTMETTKATNIIFTDKESEQVMDSLKKLIIECEAVVKAKNALSMSMGTSEELMCSDELMRSVEYSKAAFREDMQ